MDRSHGRVFNNDRALDKGAGAECRDEESLTDVDLIRYMERVQKKVAAEVEAEEARARSKKTREEKKNANGDGDGGEKTSGISAADAAARRGASKEIGRAPYLNIRRFRGRRARVRGQNLYTIIGRAQALPGKGTELYNWFKNELYPKFLEEEGTLVYAIHQEVDNPDVLWVYETFSSEGAHQNHQNIYTDELLESMSELMLEGPNDYVPYSMAPSAIHKGVPGLGRPTEVTHLDCGQELYTIIGRAQALPGKGNELYSWFKNELYPKFIEEEGTLVYAIHQEVDDPDVLWVYETFTSEGAHEEHQNIYSDELLASMSKLTVEEPDDYVRYELAPSAIHKGVPGFSI